jgi:glycosyltransferase involved in cell wall biosynthesis
MLEGQLPIVGSHGQAGSVSTPFFSIGVTTYNRRELLKETLLSIIGQTFSDFEVIVGNDYTQESLSAELLDIQDQRIRFINHAQNLGEIKNMNSLLAMSRGRYFTWLADDDMYTPGFLESVHASLIKFGFPPCAFTSFMNGVSFPGKIDTSLGEGQLFKGRQFLQLYLTHTLKTQGCYGVFDVEYLRRIGGIEQLGNGFSPYSDVLLAIQSGLLEKIVYIDAPLIFFRTHESSISYTNPDFDAYSSAQEDLCRKCINIFSREGLRDDFQSNLSLLLKWCIKDFSTVVRRSGSINGKQVITYLLFVRRYISLLRGSTLYWGTIGFFIKTMVRLVLGISKARLSRWLISSNRSYGLFAKQKKG